ncbi:type II toxin-antitoxin system VapB family antitoxin [Azospirillum halopraeferens]|uniref:type II toxin-antitoxin system VapB family antitoxin n=1 Tax=Azospirillum halopraeferens TaxID=34010 RepID=UPI00041E737D|nr:type II toxin-antitoxin system VapB family antitoxin [Azospirillum halopraeferens]
MGFMIDPETERNARRLAALRNASVEEAISAAIREALLKTERPPPEHPSSSPVPPDADPLASLSPEQKAKVERTMALVRTLPPLDDDPTADLYDASGLPC